MFTMTSIIVSGILAIAGTKNTNLVPNFSQGNSIEFYLSQLPEPIPPRRPQPLPRELPENVPLPFNPNQIEFLTHSLHRRFPKKF